MSASEQPVYRCVNTRTSGGSPASARWSAASSEPSTQIPQVVGVAASSELGEVPIPSLVEVGGAGASSASARPVPASSKIRMVESAMRAFMVSSLRWSGGQAGGRGGVGQLLRARGLRHFAALVEQALGHVDEDVELRLDGGLAHAQILHLGLQRAELRARAGLRRAELRRGDVADLVELDDVRLARGDRPRRAAGGEQRDRDRDERLPALETLHDDLGA